MEKQLDLFDVLEMNEKKELTLSEKMAEYGATGFGDAELIEGLVKPYVSSKVNSKKIATSILEAMDKNLELEIKDLTCINGVSPELASGILIALEIGRRRNRNSKRTVSCPADIYKELYHYSYDEQENFIVMALNSAHEVLFVKRITTGLVNKTLAHPREVFSDVLKVKATVICMAHNHPSGNLDPSSDDIDLTKRLVLAGDLLGVKVLDHLILSTNGWYSFLEHGML